jgi:cytochrome c biogenesis protein CcmG/thiol:disulfide interchange protein DsbE
MTSPKPTPKAWDPAAKKKRSPLIFVPVFFFGVIASLFLVRLVVPSDPSLLPSALVGKPAPPFALPAVEGLDGCPGFSDADLRQGKVTLVNVFASWCVPCHQEQATLMRLAKDPALASLGVRIAGLAYKDEPANILKFLGQDGNPFAMVGADINGRVAIDLGVYGVPETFIVRGDGAIAYRFVGPITEAAYEQTILPEIEKAQQPTPVPSVSANPPR